VPKYRYRILTGKVAKENMLLFTIIQMAMTPSLLSMLSIGYGYVGDGSQTP